MAGGGIMNGFAKRWVAALRSGEFKQTRGMLHWSQSDRDEGYCCLGVACELFYRERPEDLKRTIDRGVIFYDGCKYSLPDLVIRSLGMVSLGLNGSSGKPSDKSLMSIPGGEEDIEGWSLSEINDKGATFEQIADLIERTPALFSS